MKDGRPNALTFGIYPGSAVGDTGPAGPPDRPDHINQALAQLQGSPGRPFIVRAYDAYVDPGDTVHATLRQAPADYHRYLTTGSTSQPSRSPRSPTSGSGRLRVLLPVRADDRRLHP